MKKSIFVAMALAMGLSACAHHRGHADTASALPDARAPRVFVKDNTHIIVNQEPLRFKRGDRDVTITWSLPKDSTFTFPDDGIVIAKAGDEFKCGVEADRRKFSCLNRNTKPGTYKYTIKVLDRTRGLEPLDPIIVNDP